jgi:hypothetical protein
VDCGERWRDRDRESGRVTGRGWRVESIGSWHSALRQLALEWVKASSGPDSSQLQRELRDCGRKKKGRRSVAVRRGAEVEEKGGS